MPFKDLLEYAPETNTRLVKIGDQECTVRGLFDPSLILKLTTEAEAFKSHQAGNHLKHDGKPIHLHENEITAYLFLREGLDDEEKPSFDDIVKISRKTGLDCLNAGLLVMELSGLVPEEAKTEAGEENSVAVEAKND